jgi:hypothetical protein
MASGRIIFKGDAKATKANLRPVMKIAGKATVRRWHDKFMKRHFTRSGFTLYKYASRSILYNRRKLKSKGHQLPLVWTGVSRFKAKTAFNITESKKRRKLAPGQKRAKRGAGVVNIAGVMRVDSYFFKYNKKHSRIDKGAELVRVARPERTDMLKFYNRIAKGKLKTTKSHRVVRIRR